MGVRAWFIVAVVLAIGVTAAAGYFAGQESKTAGISAAASVLQLFTALALAALTYRLVVSTDSYAKSAVSTDSYAKSADRQVQEMASQLEELVRGRLSGMRPYVFVRAVVAQPPEPGGGDSYWLDVYCRNWGRGPAFMVHGEVSGSWFTYTPIRESQSLTSDQESKDFRIGRIDLQAPPAPDRSSDILLRLEYRDLAEIHWATTVSVRAARPAQGQLNLAVRHQTHRITEIPAFTIPVDALTPDEDAGA